MRLEPASLRARFARLYVAWLGWLTLAIFVALFVRHLYRPRDLVDILLDAFFAGFGALVDALVLALVVTLALLALGERAPGMRRPLRWQTFAWIATAGALFGLLARPQT